MGGKGGAVLGGGVFNTFLVFLTIAGLNVGMLVLNTFLVFLHEG